MDRSVKIVLLAIGVAILVGVVAGVAWLASGPESGVKMANEMDEYALDYLDRHQLLTADEKLVCYYDVTLSMDGSEAAILTNQRLLYHKAGRTTAMLLAEVVDIQHHYESLIGDVIMARTASGEVMKIEIAPLNGGESFLHALNGAWQQARGQPSLP
jgi:hypothetical protein